MSLVYGNVFCLVRRRSSCDVRDKNKSQNVFSVLAHGRKFVVNMRNSRNRSTNGYEKSTSGDGKLPVEIRVENETCTNALEKVTESFRIRSCRVLVFSDYSITSIYNKKYFFNIVLLGTFF